MDTIILRNTISGVSHAFPADYARRILADPFLGKNQVEVDSEKPEVLSPEHSADERKVNRTGKADAAKNEES
jgi:hypothetical protein